MIGMKNPTSDAKTLGLIDADIRTSGEVVPVAAEVPALRRSKQKQPAILQKLREQIVHGKWQPGERLPSRGEFEVETGVSRVTVQKVFDRLVREGFIEVQGRRETRVAKSPPHLSRYALAFPFHPSDTNNWNRYWTVLADVARGIRHADGTPAIEVFYNVDGHTDVREYRELLTAARHHLAAGMIFVGIVPRLRQTPLLLDTHIPKVLVSRSSMLASGGHVSTVTSDNIDFFDRAVGHLASKGCKTLAIVMSSGESYEESVLPALNRYGMTCPSYWLHGIVPESRETAASLLHLILRHPEDRPDGLIVADDHFTTAATAGLLAAGVRVPQDLHVVVHENFPSHAESPLPFTRLGFDARETLSNCLHIIDGERKSGKPSMVRCNVPSRFSTELAGDAPNQM